MTTTIPKVEPRPGRMKQCSLCGGWFPICCFNRCRQYPDGRDYRCRDCRNRYREQLRKRDREARPRRARGVEVQTFRRVVLGRVHV
jgi:hypothetical protein